ncbi:DUF3566 domain-containing protein [Aeromicrobium sp. CF3.5]|uniref:DUF3566 domain-containing protein n=1 Tax=Aeromicrobium sp. CF3.5 TaxID=3373078 RepID=UPI003EE58A97
MSDESPETTDKGRPRPAGSGPAGSGQAGSTKTGTQAAKKAPAAKKASAAKTAAAPTGSGKTAAGKTAEAKTTRGPASAATTTTSTGRALTANDYAASTSNSASSTAVIPAVKDEPAATPKAAPAPAQNEQFGGGAGRAATLRLSHVDPWSVTRMAFAISVALMVVAVVAVAIFWLVLEALGIWDTVDNSVTSVLSDDATAFSITDYLGFGRLVGLTLVLSALNVVIATVLATIAAHLYNLGAQLLGGFQVTYTSQD